MNALEYIETHLDYVTEIIASYPMEYEWGDGLNYTVARGGARIERMTVRPMFQVMPNVDGGPFGIPQPPCHWCGDFSRSWNCPDHAEPGFIDFLEATEEY